MTEYILTDPQIYAVLYHLPSLKWDVEVGQNGTVIKAADTDDVVCVAGKNWVFFTMKVASCLEDATGDTKEVEIHQHFRYILDNCKTRSAAAQKNVLDLFQELWMTAVMNPRGTHSDKVRKIINEIYHRVRGHADFDTNASNW